MNNWCEFYRDCDQRIEKIKEVVCREGFDAYIEQDFADYEKAVKDCNESHERCLARKSRLDNLIPVMGKTLKFLTVDMEDLCDQDYFHQPSEGGDL